MFFIANHGQAPRPVEFMAQGSGLTAYFSPGEVLFQQGGVAVRMQLAGARRSARIEGLGLLSGHANFLIGDEEQWRSGVPLYGSVAFREIYPGIDMIYGGNDRNLKSEFTVAPGADPSRILIRYSGAGPLRLENDGTLVIPVQGRALREQAPVLFQHRQGRRVVVEGRFKLVDNDSVGFMVGDYDPSLPLIIDPVLSYSTLLGGSYSDAATALAVNATGSAYVAGFTSSYDFPTANPAQAAYNGSNDVFVAKLNPAGNALLYCTYIGGRGDDRAYGIAIDGTGAAYVTGSTTSTNFPIRGALQSKLAGGKNAFVFKLNPAGNSLVFSTYLGGGGSDTANGIAIDGSTNVYVTGDTTSLNFPASGIQPGKHGGQDVFISKLSADGAHLLYSTYLGGGNDDHASAIVVDAGGSAYLTGSTWSTDFPVAAAWQNKTGGAQDAFVARLSADGRYLLFSTYLGGSGGTLGYPESGQGAALDGQGNVYVTGVTSSSNFPTLQAFQVSRKGSLDAFVAKLSATGTLVYSTYLGGTGVDVGNAIAVNSSGNAYVAGQTFSSDLAVVFPFQSVTGGDYDAFWAKLSTGGDSLLSLSYLGGVGSDTATAIAMDSAENVYLAGWTLSPNFPIQQGFQSTNAGNYGAFIAKVVLGAPPAIVGVTPSSGTGTTQTFSYQFSDASGAANLSTVSMLLNSSVSTSSACSVTYTRASNTLSLLTDSGLIPAGTISPGSGSLQNSQCALNGSGSTVSLAGNTLTLSLSITFQPGFSGTRNVYQQATNPNGSVAWQQTGTWTVPLGPPAPASVTPASGSGQTQAFSFVFTDPKGYAALRSVSIMISKPLSSVAGCYLLYYPPSKLLYLANDAGSAWLGPVTVGLAGTLQNSQCAVDSYSSSGTAGGNNVTLNLTISFQPAYAGARDIYMEAYDGIDSGFVLKGSWTVAVALGGLSVTPNSGSGGSQAFSLVFTDPGGYGALNSVSMMINSSLTGVSACYALYYPRSKALYLMNDAATAWLGPVTLGVSGTVQNSQCSVNPSTSSSSGAGNVLTVNLAITFLGSFKGSKNVYLEAYDGADSGWARRGGWTIP